MVTKLQGIVLALTFGLATTAALSAREFTDAKGRKIQADLVAHAGDSIIIARGGKEFTIPINSLSLDDQAYVAQWIQENPNAVRLNFSYFVDLDDGMKQNAKVDYDERLQTIPKTYSLSISNQSPGPLEGATVKAMVFVEDFVDTRNGKFRSLNSGIKPRSGRIQRILATVPVESVKPKGRVDVDMIFPIHYYVDRDFGRVDNAVKDKVIGVWIRVYKGDQLLGERTDAENDKKMEEMQWQEAGAEKNEPKVKIR